MGNIPLLNKKSENIQVSDCLHNLHTFEIGMWLLGKLSLLWYIALQNKSRYNKSTIIDDTKVYILSMCLVLALATEGWTQSQPSICNLVIPSGALVCQQQYYTIIHKLMLHWVILMTKLLWHWQFNKARCGIHNEIYASMVYTGVCRNPRLEPWKPHAWICIVLIQIFVKFLQ